MRSARFTVAPSDSTTGPPGTHELVRDTATNGPANSAGSVTITEPDPPKKPEPRLITMGRIFTKRRNPTPLPPIEVYQKPPIGPRLSDAQRQRRLRAAVKRHGKKPGKGFALAAALLLLCLFASAPAWAAETLDLTPTETAMVQQCNAFRVRNGLPALKPAAWLMSRARSHCRWMLSHGMIHSAGIAENIATGQPSVNAVTNTWANSSGHRANMLASHGGYIGVAGYRTPSGTPYWVQQFGGKDGSPVAIEGGLVSTVARKTAAVGRRMFGRLRR